MNAVLFYERLGFRSEARISMSLQDVGGSERSVLYEELSLVFRPSSMPSL